MKDISSLLFHGLNGNTISIDPVDDQAVDANGAAIALSTFEGHGPVTIIAVVGPGGFTPTAANRLELEVEESEDGSTFTDVANANLSRTHTPTAGGTASNTGCFAYVDATNRDDKIYSTTYLPTSGAKTHIRVVANFTGTVTGGIPLAAFVTEADPHDAPSTQ